VDAAARRADGHADACRTACIWGEHEPQRTNTGAGMPRASSGGGSATTRCVQALIDDTCAMSFNFFHLSGMQSDIDDITPKVLMMHQVFLALSYTTTRVSSTDRVVSSC